MPGTASPRFPGAAYPGAASPTPYPLTTAAAKQPGRALWTWR